MSAYPRLVGNGEERRWDGRRHFFAAAAEAMRPNLVENARRERAEIHARGRGRVELSECDWLSRTKPEGPIAIDESLSRLAEEGAASAGIDKLVTSAGMSIEQAARCLGTSLTPAYRHRTYARAGLLAERRT